MSSVAQKNLNTQAKRPRRGPAAATRVAPATFPLDNVGLPSGGVILRSADCVDFRVYKSILAIASPVFRDMFDVGKADATEGLLPDNPIRLDGVSVEDFRQLLRAIYHT